MKILIIGADPVVTRALHRACSANDIELIAVDNVPPSPVDVFCDTKSRKFTPSRKKISKHDRRKI